LLSALANAVEATLAPEKDLPAGNGRRGDKYLIRHCIGRQGLELFSHAENDNVLVFTRQVELAICSNGRGLEVVGLGQPNLVIIGLAGAGVVAADHAVIGQSIKLVVKDDGRRRVGITFGLAPCDRV